MTNNDILIRVRFALNLKNPEVIEIFRLSAVDIANETLDGYLRKEEAEGHIPCPGEHLKAFLQGLVISKRGAKDDKKPAADFKLNNNFILKSLKIALQLKDDDIAQALELAGMRASKSEINALLQAEGHKNFQACRDQFLRNFLKGLTIRYRGPLPAGKAPDTDD